MLLTWNMFTGVIPKSVERKTGTRGGVKMDRGATKMRRDGWQKWIRGGSKNELAGAGVVK